MIGLGAPGISTTLYPEPIFLAAPGNPLSQAGMRAFGAPVNPLLSPAGPILAAVTKDAAPNTTIFFAGDGMDPVADLFYPIFWSDVAVVDQAHAFRLGADDDRLMNWVVPPTLPANAGILIWGKTSAGTSRPLIIGKAEAWRLEDQGTLADPSLGTAYNAAIVGNTIAVYGLNLCMPISSSTSRTFDGTTTSLTFTVPAGLNITGTQAAQILPDVEGDHRLEGTITYNSSSNTVTLTIDTTKTRGGGTFSSWSIYTTSYCWIRLFAGGRYQFVPATFASPYCLKFVLPASITDDGGGTAGTTTFTAGTSVQVYVNNGMVGNKYGWDLCPQALSVQTPTTMFMNFGGASRTLSNFRSGYAAVPSSTNVTIDQSSTKTFTTASDPFVTGDVIWAVDLTTPGRYMKGTVQSHSATQVVMSIPTAVNGTGNSSSNWHIAPDLATAIGLALADVGNQDCKLLLGTGNYYVSYANLTAGGGHGVSLEGNGLTNTIVWPLPDHSFNASTLLEGQTGNFSQLKGLHVNTLSIPVVTNPSTDYATKIGRAFDCKFTTYALSPMRWDGMHGFANGCTFIGHSLYGSPPLASRIANCAFLMRNDNAFYNESAVYLQSVPGLSYENCTVDNFDNNATASPGRFSGRAFLAINFAQNVYIDGITTHKLNPPTDTDQNKAEQILVHEANNGNGMTGVTQDTNGGMTRLTFPSLSNFNNSNFVVVSDGKGQHQSGRIASVSGNAITLDVLWPVTIDANSFVNFCGAASRMVVRNCALEGTNATNSSSCGVQPYSAAAEVYGDHITVKDCRFGLSLFGTQVPAGSTPNIQPAQVFNLFKYVDLTHCQYGIRLIGASPMFANIFRKVNAAQTVLAQLTLAHPGTDRTVYDNCTMTGAPTGITSVINPPNTSTENLYATSITRGSAPLSGSFGLDAGSSGVTTVLGGGSAISGFESNNRPP